MWRWVRLVLVVIVGLALLAAGVWLYDQVVLHEVDPFTGRARQPAPRGRLAVNPVAPPALPPGPDQDRASGHGPPDVDLAEVPEISEFGRPPVVLHCDVGDLTEDSTGLYVSHAVIKKGTALLPGAQPAMVTQGELRLPALADQSEAEVFFGDVGLVRLTWEKTAAGDVTCEGMEVVAPPVVVRGEVVGERGPLERVTVVGCGGVARTDRSGAFSMRVAGGRTCTLRAVRFEGEVATWGPSTAWVPHPAQHLVLQWAQP